VIGQGYGMDIGGCNRLCRGWLGWRQPHRVEEHRRGIPSGAWRSSRKRRSPASSPTPRSSLPAALRYRGAASSLSDFNLVLQVGSSRRVKALRPRTLWLRCGFRRWRPSATTTTHYPSLRRPTLPRFVGDWGDRLQRAQPTVEFFGCTLLRAIFQPTKHFKTTATTTHYGVMSPS
jgi:hypothetical protein